MYMNLKKLAEIGSKPRSSLKIDLDSMCFLATMPANLVAELGYLLTLKNGFYAFESALNVYSGTQDDLHTNLFSANTDDSFLKQYDITVPVVFFAEDLFLNLFGIVELGVFKLDLETGEFELHSSNLDGWAEKILGNYNYETGWSLASEWQAQHGAIGNGYRLLPKRPFVMGGDYKVDNLVKVKRETGLKNYIALYNQIKFIEDGEALDLKNWLD